MERFPQVETGAPRVAGVYVRRRPTPTPCGTDQLSLEMTANLAFGGKCTGLKSASRGRTVRAFSAVFLQPCGNLALVLF